MSANSSLPSLEQLETLLQKLKKLQTEFNQHTLFVDAEISSHLSTSATDSRANLGDVLVALAHKAKVLDLRVQRLAALRFPELNAEESMSTVDKLLSYVTKPIASETSANMLRRAATRLERDIKRESNSVCDLENWTANSLQNVVDMFNELKRVEHYEETSSLVESMEKGRNWKARLAAEPEDAVWMVPLGYSIEFFERYLILSKTEERLRQREMTWLKALRWAARFGVQVGERQTLITEFFEWE